MTAPATPSPQVLQGYEEALQALRRLQKPAGGVSWYSVAINRPAGRRLAAAAFAAGRTPNQITVLSALCSFTAAGLLAVLEPSVLLGIVVSVLLAAGFALDSADGQLARLRGSGGPFGEWLDHVVDCGSKLALHSAVLVAWYRFTDPPDLLLLVPLLFLSVAVLLFFSGTLVELLRRAGTGQRPPAPRRSSRVLLLPVDHGTISWSFLLWGWQDAFATVYTVLLGCYVLLLGALCVKWARELA